MYSLQNEYYLRADCSKRLSSDLAGSKLSLRPPTLGLIVEYMDRAQGPTMDFCAQHFCVALLA